MIKLAPLAVNALLCFKMRKRINMTDMTAHLVSCFIEGNKAKTLACLLARPNKLVSPRPRSETYNTKLKDF